MTGNKDKEKANANADSNENGAASTNKLLWLNIVALVAIAMVTSWILDFDSQGVNKITSFFTLEKSPVVEISTGDIQGFASWSRSGSKYLSFLGIRFASPPVGNLRFESPVPAGKWDGIRGAFHHGAECKQLDFLFSGVVKGDEDCLFLNVFTHDVIAKRDEKEDAQTGIGRGKDDKVQKKEKKKVLVFIHGGGLQMGSASMYGADFFMDHENIVLVTIQYRLGIFGFLSSGDEIVKGNMGLRDIVQSLKWIKENIAQFHGDPDQVTIFGESAGAASVHALMLSPLAQGLFSRAISWSTNVLAGGRQQHKSNSSTLFFNAASDLNCSIESSRISADCLKSKSDDEILAWQWNLNPNDENFRGDIIVNDKSSHKFLLTVENHNDSDNFMTENPLALLQKGKIHNPVPWLYGINQNEALIWVAKILQDEELSKNLQDQDFFIESLPHLMSFGSVDYSREVLIKIHEHYFPNGTIDLSTRRDILQLADLMNDKDLVKQLRDGAVLGARKGPVYLFHYSYKGSVTFFNVIRWGSPLFGILSPEFSGFLRHLQAKVMNFFSPESSFHFGSSHGDELCLLFNIHPVIKLHINWYDYEMSRKLVQTVVDFATLPKLDNFHFNGVKWPKYDTREVEQKSMPVMDLNLKGQLLKDPFRDRMKFWTSLNLTNF